MSTSGTGSQTFNITHAKYLASKVAADLKRIQRFYHYPTDSEILAYENEMVEFLRMGYLDKVTYGFKKNDEWIEPSLIYTAQDLAGLSSSDDDPGKIKPGANIAGAVFTSHMSYTSAYFSLTADERESFKNTLPFKRTPRAEPGVNGYVSSDNSYSAGGKSLNRSSVKSY